MSKLCLWTVTCVPAMSWDESVKYKYGDDAFSPEANVLVIECEGNEDTCRVQRSIFNIQSPRH